MVECVAASRSNRPMNSSALGFSNCWLIPGRERFGYYEANGSAKKNRPAKIKNRFIDNNSSGKIAAHYKTRTHDQASHQTRCSNE